MTVDAQTMVADPYALLGVDQDADPEAIAAACRGRLEAGTDREAIEAAARLLGDPEQRLRFAARWHGTILAPLPEPRAPAAEPFYLPALVRELAFLSDWEVGG